MLFDDFRNTRARCRAVVSLAPTVIHIGDGPEVAVSGFGGAGGVEAAGATPLEGFVALSIGGLGGNKLAQCSSATTHHLPAFLRGLQVKLQG